MVDVDTKIPVDATHKFYDRFYKQNPLDENEWVAWSPGIGWTPVGGIEPGMLQAIEYPVYGLVISYDIRDGRRGWNSIIAYEVAKPLFDRGWKPARHCKLLIVEIISIDLAEGNIVWRLKK